jgi:hypothetical protein
MVLSMKTEMTEVFLPHHRYQNSKEVNRRESYSLLEDILLSCELYFTEFSTGSLSSQFFDFLSNIDISCLTKILQERHQIIKFSVIKIIAVPIWQYDHIVLLELDVII